MKKKRPIKKRPAKSAFQPKEVTPVGTEDGVRLNKFLAHAGICSRREADKLIAKGMVKINGEVVSEVGTKVQPTDKVEYNGKRVMLEKAVYILMNKPRDFICTLSDPEGRKTVIDLLGDKVQDRVYPVGRLDRDTTGVLLLTNDGDLSAKLTHPRYEIAKMYHAKLDKAVKEEHLQQLVQGLELEDGMVQADEAKYVEDSTNRKEVGLTLHSGKNRVVRRMFEHLGYRVVRLDRVSFAGMTKKRTPRGKWRFLSEKEVQFLKMK